MSAADGPSGDSWLPIDDVVGDVRGGLASSDTLVIVAAPGAGKTTRLPLVFLDEGWCQGRRLILVEPRRLAARAAAERMASLLGEGVGETVGIRTRLDTRVGRGTRIEVVTEGVFTRQILSDPSLDGVAAVVFDEFHERALEADLGLALALDARAGLRDDLKLVVMSATLDGARVADLLGGAPVIVSEGRAFPIETRYVGRVRDMPLPAHVAQVVARSLTHDEGDILVFLPGQSEIMRTRDRLLDLGLGDGTGAQWGGDGLDILPLYGAMPYAEQKRVLEPAGPGRRKVILSTAIAETSLTIEGVRVVVDCGLSRVPRFDAATGTSRLETVRSSRASVDQRRGRAGRTAPGVCYRLWDEPETRALAGFDTPEILSSDLSGLVLDCAEWGVFAPDGLAWLDPPPEGRWAAAREDLEAIGALDADGRLTPDGRAIRALPLPARLARMVLMAARSGARAAGTAADLAAIMSERGLGGASLDAGERIAAFGRDRGERAKRTRDLAKRWAALALELSAACARGAGVPPTDGAAAVADGDVAAILALAFPDRIAMARGDLVGGEGAMRSYLMANGRQADVPATDAIAKSPFLVVADLQGQARAARVLLAAPLDRRRLDRIAGARIVRLTQSVYDEVRGAVIARDVERLGELVLMERPAKLEAGADVALALAEGAARHGIERLGWSAHQRQLRQRVGFLRRSGVAGAWPDLSEEVLSATPGEWLAPFLPGLTRLEEIDAQVLGHALDALIPWDMRQRLESEAPTHFIAPTGSRIAIDYEGPGAPAIDIRVQELFGLDRHPSIAGGRLPLTLRLLSPARRPIQITTDLPGFWAGSWADVKADMRGRYPKHVWPDDPATAAPTTRAKPRGM